MKSIIAILFVMSMAPAWAMADEDDKPETSTVQIQGGKLIGEKHEIEIYDYHSGTYQTVDVYRKPAKSLKKDSDNPTSKQSSESAPR
ncbi:MULTISPECIES: hypothetical protein [Methylomonas]|uniref:DUF2782 domain-containing protein n=2 Tax=Methylomonas TaxID=416 RepID=A0A140E666_9GAMM|nr:MULTISPECIES: hypothetical protein [Methylomonas]AMK78890.1 hypothetical protein JT25_020780 [Methylomonas denitrificans]OAI02161.1 hypothetical protein A1342_02710 [Methylomonas methanica]TCV78246.1 hypothetical protein EDE11_12421 [Methylomonas methanica]